MHDLSHIDAIAFDLDGTLVDGAPEVGHHGADTAARRT